MPIYDSDKNLRGNLKHVCYSGNSRGSIDTTPILSGNSMYVSDAVYGAGRLGGDPYLAQRTGSGQHPGSAARLRLSAGESAGLGECHPAGLHCPAPRA